MELKAIVLNKGKESSIERKHPWLFSGAINRIISDTGEAPYNGELVEVVDFKNNFLALGYFSDGTIAVRIVSFEQVDINQDFWNNKIQAAYNLRQVLGLTENPSTNMYRLMHAEGDGIPGLIIDFYNGTAVVQTHSIGVYNAMDEICTALQKVYGKSLLAIYNKSAESLAKQTNEETTNDYIIKNAEPKLIGLEDDNQYHLDWIDGQKTGFFLDQRENRKLLGSYAKNKMVLNTFCYSGGFSVAALKVGAKEVHSVDSSQKAIELADENVKLNGYKNHQSFVSDTLDYLKANKTEYDVIVLDPPAYAKNHKAKHNAIQGYKRLNSIALKQIKPGGILFTFSCSQAINRKTFYDTITAAAIEVGRNIRVIEHLSQPADHPVNIYHPEGEYLKGLVLYVS